MMVVMGLLVTASVVSAQESFHVLTLTVTGTAGGMVESNDGGIHCPTHCEHAYLRGTVVTLTAMPLAGSVFAGWSGGDCSGTGPCAVTMNAALSVTATFVPATGAPALVAAVLPSSRSVMVGTPATAFALIINVGPGPATRCGLSPLHSLPVTFTFQPTDPATNQVTGTANTPVDIPAGAAQSFVFAFTPTAPIAPTDVELIFNCENSATAPINLGLNTVLLSASATPVPDIVALAATLNNDGIVNIPGATGTGVFAMATVNVGTSEIIFVTADFGGNVILPVNVSICQTDPPTGACLAPPTISIATQIEANTTPTFGIFVTGEAHVPFDPGTNRAFVRFRSVDGSIRGSTSVAVRTQ